MLGDFINRCLILILGYAYPGFECYKTVEKNRVDIEELRFWCKYWIIVALFTVIEKFADIFFSWLPLYGEMKLVLFIYLWYPKTKGTGYIYEIVLRPIVSRHENDIDRKILEWKARSWDYVIFYWQYCAQFGQGAFVQVLHYLASQSTKITPNLSATQKKNEDGQSVPQQQEVPSTQASLNKMKQSPSISRSKKWPPSPPSSEEEAFEAELAGEDVDQKVSVRDKISNARARLRRLDSEKQNPRTPRTPNRRELS